MSVFTKKHYKLVAECVWDVHGGDRATQEAIVVNMCEMFVKDNPAFDKEKFMIACLHNSDSR